MIKNSVFNHPDTSVSYDDARGDPYGKHKLKRCI